MTSNRTSLLPAGSEADLHIPFTELSFQWRQIEGKALPDIHRLFQNGAFSLGPFVAQFEQAAADYLGIAHAIGVNSGTSALHLALIVAGIGPGDKVLVPSYTFVATAWAVLYVGATPVLCDIEEESANIDLGDAEERLDAAVKAIIPVHLYGQPADMAGVMAFAARHRLVVIEDAAQAIGARFDGRCVGTFGLCGCYSFYPAKNLGAAGEAGLVVTADEALARRLLALRHHAQSERYVHTELGFNYRMEGIQGVILGHKLPLLDSWMRRTRVLADIVREFEQRAGNTPPHRQEARGGQRLIGLSQARRQDGREMLVDPRIVFGAVLKRLPGDVSMSNRTERWPMPTGAGDR